MNYGRAYSPPCEGGVSAPSKNGFVPKTARTGWSLTSYVSKYVLKHWLVSDHPVCGASVAARLFIDAAATPPLQGGECAPLNSASSLEDGMNKLWFAVLARAIAAPD